MTTSWWPSKTIVYLTLITIAVLSFWVILSNFWLCHMTLRLLTKVEALVTTGSGSTPERSTPAPSIPFYIHAARSSRNAAANSLGAVKQTAEKFKRVELDVGFSRDLIPYLSHADDLTQRTGRPMGSIEEQFSTDLNRLPLLEGTPLLRLGRFVKEFADGFDEIILDVKTSHHHARDKARVLSSLIDSRLEKRVIVVSLSGVFLRWLKQKAPGIPLGCESYLATGNWLVGFDMVSLHYSQVNQFQDSLARKFDLERLYWTGYTKTQLEQILAWQPTRVIVDLVGEDPPHVPGEWRKITEDREK